MPSTTDPRPRRRRSAHVVSITQRQAQRAVYLDFEGFKEASPVLAGLAVDGEFAWTVLDPSMELAADAKKIQVADIKDYLSDLIARCEREDRLIIGFSRREAIAVTETLGIELGDRYCNALKLARRWRNRVHTAEADKVRKRRARARQRGRWVGSKDNALIAFSQLAGIQPPRDYGYRCVTSRLRHVQDQLKSRGSYERLTPTAKGKWTKLLKHNRFDCRGLRELTIQMAHDIESRGRPQP